MKKQNIKIKDFTRDITNILLSVVFSSCSLDTQKLDGKRIVMNGKVYRMENRFAEGYWFIEKPSSDTIVVVVGE